jgi:hypothetical protein
MAKRRTGLENIQKSTYSTSGYSSNGRALSTARGGKIGRGGQATNRRKMYYDVRVGLGLSGG